MKDMNIPWKRLAVALPLCLCLAALVCALPIFPCGFFDASTDMYAGYGYHSLAEVASEGFSWDSATVPEPFEEYRGTGPFVAVAKWWVVALYIPIFLAITYLGLEISRGNVRFIRPSTT